MCDRFSSHPSPPTHTHTHTAGQNAPYSPASQGGCCELTHQFERKTRSRCVGPVSLLHEGQDVLTCEQWVMEAVIWAGTVQAVHDLGDCLLVRQAFNEITVFQSVLFFIAKEKKKHWNRI